MEILTDIVRFNRIIFRDQVFTGEYLNPAVDECALYLDKNIRSNSPIVYLVAPNHVKTVIAFLGIVKTGRAALLVDPKIGKLEYEEMLADTTPSAIVRIDPQTMELDYDKEVAITDYLMDPSRAAQLDDVAVMLYTAADDGYAKAAMLTHRNILSHARIIAEDNRVDSESTSCALLPFHHVFGFHYGIITPLFGGGRILVVDISNSRRIDLLAGELYRHRTTQLYSIPLIYYLLSKSSPFRDLCRQVHSLICGGYKLPDSLKARFEEKCTIPLLEGYGLTETSAGCLWRRRDEKYADGSIGRAVRNCQVKIFDEANNELSFGKKGEICVHGDSVMKGYFNRPQATQKTILNGWLHTGDYGKQNENGDVFFLGLKKKMFNVAGSKVYPEHLHRLLLKNNNVEKVMFSSVYNDLLGHEIHAAITLSDKSTAAGESFQQWCRDNLTFFKIPKKIVFSPEIPPSLSPAFDLSPQVQLNA